MALLAGDINRNYLSIHHLPEDSDPANRRRTRDIGAAAAKATLEIPSWLSPELIHDYARQYGGLSNVAEQVEALSQPDPHSVTMLRNQI